MSFYSEWSLTSIPNYLEAATRDELRLLIIKKQLNDGISYKWLGPPLESNDGMWVIWFEEDVQIEGLNKTKIAKQATEVR